MIRVLIVDDSAFARKVIRESLARDPEIEVVGAARDGVEAIEKIQLLDPDVVTIDLVMPDLDGVGVLRALGPDARARFVAVSVSPRESDLAFAALAAGAVDFVQKPTALATDRLYDVGDELVNKVRAAAAAKPAIRASIAAPVIAPPAPRVSQVRLIVIGTSTGGPQALSKVLPLLPDGLPPIAIALHIPAGYTKSLAARIAAKSTVRVKEAEDGAVLESGEALIAPGGRHLVIEADGDRLISRLRFDPASAIYRPSVDLLFESAAKACDGQVLAVVMTGMGEDGLKGVRALHARGARILVESERSCVVYGMPRAVAEAGLAEKVLDLEEIPAGMIACL